MTQAPLWPRLAIGLCCLLMVWGAFELATGERRRTAAEAVQCAGRNRAILAEAARFSEAQDLPQAVARLARLSQCPELSARPWILLLGGGAGTALVLLLAAVTGRLDRLERLLAQPPAAPPEPAPLAITGPTGQAEPRDPAQLPEDHPLVRQVIEEMRAQGLNISPDVARRVASLRQPRTDAGD